jgi:multidrug efflux pump subunit AcrA (membrane-fusion protein)
MSSTRTPDKRIDTRRHLPPVTSDLALAELALADAQTAFAKAAQRCTDLGRQRNGVPLHNKEEIAAGNSALDDAQAAVDETKSKRDRLRAEYQAEARAALAPALAELQLTIRVAFNDLADNLAAAQRIHAEARSTGINLGHPLLNRAATLAGQVKMIAATLAVMEKSK